MAKPNRITAASWAKSSSYRFYNYSEAVFFIGPERQKRTALKKGPWIGGGFSFSVDKPALRNSPSAILTDKCPADVGI